MVRRLGYTSLVEADLPVRRDGATALRPLIVIERDAVRLFRQRMVGAHNGRPLAVWLNAQFAVIAKQVSGASLQDVRHIDLAIHPAAPGTQIRQVLQTLYRLGTRRIQLLWSPKRPSPLPLAKDAKLARDLARRWRRFRYRLVDGPKPSDTSGNADNLQKLFERNSLRSQSGSSSLG